ncbi:methionine synthase I [Maritimibacter sp. 55A14]|uniref:holin family protein n=1 Tax=Maritimibacter sp. 55A14 TaxID=2174844 RepID=UPI000D60D897|nr:holin family protein [Maritimibacter sp. 55A14]PWE33073.1 methionine synthase I [Maritimibacter sp. 55A14]
MGVIGTVLGGLFGAGRNVITETAEVFTPNATRRMELGHEAFTAVLDQAAAEYAQAPAGGFDRFVNGLNRLPRPALALGTLGLFAYAMADPPGFAERMQGLAHVPEPLWWLLGAIVSFYFGAREMHYQRRPRPETAMPARIAGSDSSDNPALADWENSRPRDQ